MNANQDNPEQQVVIDDPFLTVAKAAEYLGLDDAVKHPAQAVRALIRKRRLRAARVSDRWMVRHSWLEAYITTNMHGVAE